MKTLILNSSNAVPNSNNQFSYLFPNNPKFDGNQQIAISSIAMYNSTFNIESSRGNNSFQIIFNFATPVTLTVVFTDGYYSASDMNNYVQQAMITAGYYATNASSQNVYWFEMVINPVYYAIEVNLYPIPTQAQATALGLTPAVGSSWSWPVTASVPQLVTLNNTWPDLIGFAKSTTFPVATQTTEISYNSSKTPIISPVNAYIIRCNLINSPFSNPFDLMYALPINAVYGGLITNSSNSLIWNDIAPNTYSNLILTFYDQLLNPLKLHDMDCVISVVIRNKNE